MIKLINFTKNNYLNAKYYHFEQILSIFTLNVTIFVNFKLSRDRHNITFVKLSKYIINCIVSMKN